MKYEVAMGDIFVNITRKVAIESRYRISSSFGYSGIQDGVVEVMYIIQPEDIRNNAVPEEYAEQIAVHIDEELRAYYEDYTKEEYEEARKELLDQPWIGYKYLTGTDATDYVLPLNLFIAHTCTAM